MMKYLQAILLAFVIMLSGCSGDATNSSQTISQNELSEDDTSAGIADSKKTLAVDLMKNIIGAEIEVSNDLSQGNDAYREFAAKLFKKSLSDEGKNSLISPLSVIFALGLTANGAGGETLKQMEEVFGITAEELNLYLYSYAKSKDENDLSKFEIANSIWFTDNEMMLTINNDFLQTNADYYNASAYKSNFSDPQTVTDINNWVYAKTNGMISEIIQQIEPDNVMFLINALAFEGEWSEQYDKNSVVDGHFTLENSEEVNVEFMHSEENVYLKDDNAEGFLKYYKDGYAFVALLPNEGVTVEEYVSFLTGEKIKSILNNKSFETLITSMPKFETEYDIEMTEIFKDVMPNAFNDTDADFSKIGQADNIYISQILHKTFISVAEKGTKAGAVTAVVVNAECVAPSTPKEIHLTRPFVYMLIDTGTNTPFFMGTMMDPS